MEEYKSYRYETPEEYQAARKKQTQDCNKYENDFQKICLGDGLIFPGASPPEYRVYVKEKILSAEFQNYVSMRGKEMEGNENSTRMFQPSAEMRLALSPITSVAFFRQDYTFYTLVFCVQDSDHCDNSELYKALDNYLKRHIECTIPSQTQADELISLEDQGMLVVTFADGNPMYRNLAEIGKLLKKLKEKMPEYYAPLLIDSTSSCGNSILTELDIPAWEKNLKEKFSDPDLKLVRVPGENNGKIRLLIKNPETSKEMGESFLLAFGGRVQMIGECQIDVSLSGITPAELSAFENTYRPALVAPLPQSEVNLCAISGQQEEKLAVSASSGMGFFPLPPSSQGSQAEAQSLLTPPGPPEETLPSLSVKTGH